MADLFVPDEGDAVIKADKPKSREAISVGMRFHIMRRDNFTCQYCGAQAPDAALHVDHVVPVVRGGGNEPDNLIVACVRCNIGKGVRNAQSDDERPLTERERKLQSRADWYHAKQRRLSWVFDLQVDRDVKAVLYALAVGTDPYGSVGMFEKDIAAGCGMTTRECATVIRGLEAVGYITPMECHLTCMAGGAYISVNVNSDREEREYMQPPKRPAYSDFLGQFLPTVERVHG